MRRLGKGSDFLDRADADTVRLAEGTIDGTSFGHPHFGAADQWGDIGGVGVAVADEDFVS